MTEKKKRINWKRYLMVSIGLLVFGIGILVGIQIGTYAVIDHFAYGLAGSTFIVNFNETRFVNQMVEQLYPIFNQSFSKLNSEEVISIPPNPKGIGYP